MPIAASPVAAPRSAAPAPAPPPAPLPATLARVLLVQSDHHLGNAVLSLPVVAAFARHFDAGVDLLVDARYASLPRGIPGVRRVLEMPAQRDGFGRKRADVPRILVLLARLAARRYDAVVDLAGTVRTGTVVRAAGWRTRHRVGFLQARRSKVYAWRIDAPDAARTGTHFFDRYARLLAAAGRADGDPWPTPVRPAAGERERAAVDRKITAAFPDARGPLVVLHPAAGIAWRCWPAERFGRVAAGLVRERDARVLVVGVPGDRERAEAVRAAAGPAAAVRIAFACWPLAELVALLERADLLVSNESGPTHLAAAVGTPIATVFGPTSETRWRPLPVNPNRLRVLRGSACDPGCHGRTCVAGRKCLLELPEARVLEAAGALLDAGRRPLGKRSGTT